MADIIERAEKVNRNIEAHNQSVQEKKTIGYFYFDKKKVQYVKGMG